MSKKVRVISSPNKSLDNWHFVGEDEEKFVHKIALSSVKFFLSEIKKDFHIFLHPTQTGLSLIASSLDGELKFEVPFLTAMEELIKDNNVNLDQSRCISIAKLFERQAKRMRKEQRRMEDEWELAKNSPPEPRKYSPGKLQKEDEIRSDHNPDLSDIDWESG